MDQLPPGIDPSTIPFAKNPNGGPPDFDSPVSLEPTVLGTGLAFVVISGICVFLRGYTGLKKARKLFADDYLCVAGFVLGTANWAVFYTMMTHGLGKHSWSVPITVLTLPVMKLQLANQMLAVGAHFAVKASLIWFFNRVFGTLRWVRVTCWALLVLTALCYASYEVVVLVFCVPRSGEAWDHVILARCSTSAPSTIAVGVGSVVADLVLFVMPFPIIAGLSLTRQKKKALALLFLVGLLVVVTSVVGLAYRVIVSYDTNDPIWNGANVAITAYMEIFGTVIVACAPSLSSFWVNIFTQSSLYTSLRSTLLRTWPQSGAAATGHQSGASIQATKRFRTSNSSSRELVDDDFPLNPIQKSTMIIQSVSKENPSHTEQGWNKERWDSGSTPHRPHGW